MRPTSQSIDEAVAELAARQHGLLTTAQLRELELSRKVVARRVAKGQWVRFAPRVIRLAGTPITWTSQVHAHVLAAGTGAVASHRSAAVLWGLDGVHRCTPEITVPVGRRYCPSEARVHHSSDLDRTTIANREGVPCTTVERTLLDLGAVVSERSVLLAVDSARRQKLTDWDGLVRTLETHARRGRDGVATLRAIVDRHLDEVRATDNGFERLMFVLLVQAGLPKPVLQHAVTVGHRTYRPDLAYPDRRIAIELDGGIHLRRDVWEADHARQNALVLAGWTVLRFTWRDYKNQATRVVAEVRAALQRPGR